ncbi:SDR family oxidoreductase [Amycolatopsis dongchuanensis]|uniref:ABM domain-containing protein n=1 Tax=Amycolatopsis dongchuanensis TaxID=1070866 RepID=A0ABP8VEP9_9PSEU
MVSTNHHKLDVHDLSGRRVLVPGGTGGVGEGVVRRYLAAGADVVVPTRTEQRAEEFRKVLGDAATARLHLVVHDYTSFAGAEGLATEMARNLGGIDDVVAPIGGFWSGRRLWEIDESDWQTAFVGLATAHAAVMRACVPHLSPSGAYCVVVGESAVTPVPTAGLVSMEQSALLMMQRVLTAELGGDRRVFALVLGPVRTRSATAAGPGWVTADEVGDVAVAASAGSLAGREIQLRDQGDVSRAIAVLRNGRSRAEAVVTMSTMRPKPGRESELLDLLGELATQIRAEPGCLRYSAHLTRAADHPTVLILMEFESSEAFEAHSARIAEQVPRIGALLETPPAPPALFGSDMTTA